MTFEGAIRKGGDWKVVVVALSRECPEPSVRERANNSGGAIEGRKKRGGWEGNKTQTRAALSLLRTVSGRTTEPPSFSPGRSHCAARVRIEAISDDHSLQSWGGGERGWEDSCGGYIAKSKEENGMKEEWKKRKMEKNRRRHPPVLPPFSIHERRWPLVHAEREAANVQFVSYRKREEKRRRRRASR